MSLADALALANILITRVLQAILIRADSIETSDLPIRRTAEQALAERAAQRQS